MKKAFTTKVFQFLVIMILIAGIFAGCAQTRNTSADSTNSSTTGQGSSIGENDDTTDVSPSPGAASPEASPTPNPDSSGEAGPEPGSDENPSSPDGASKPDAEKVKAKALYLTGWTAGNPDKVEHYINLANNTEINAYVIDIKDDDGLIGYDTNVPAAKEIGAWHRKYNVDEVLKRMHENNIYVIGRLVCFKDPVYSIKNPELAFKNTKGGLWKEKLSDGSEISWLNPYNKGSWPYLIDIAKEAVQKGFDEIQFDYVRFPGAGKGIDYGVQTQEMHEVINEFLAYARSEMPDTVLSADVYGIICESPGDVNKIGQYLELVGKDIDYISPMVYPSHYAKGQMVNGVEFMKPDLDPYGVVYNSLAKAKNRISGVQDYKASVRPYLQDFDAPWLGKGYYQQYAEAQLKQQIQAVYDAGYEEWIFWDPHNTYHEDAFIKE